MPFRLEGYLELPEHRGEGGFDHAAVHRDLRRLYVAHTSNDAIDVIDLDEMRHVSSMDGLGGVAGPLVAESWDLVFTSNRGEDTMGIFDARRPGSLVKVPVGRRPNGLAFDSVRRTLLVANVGDPASHTVSIVETDRAVMSAPMEVGSETLRSYSDWFVLTHVVSLTGWPALALPSTPTANGLPLGIQLIGRPRCSPSRSSRAIRDDGR